MAETQNQQLSRRAWPKRTPPTPLDTGGAWPAPFIVAHPNYQSAKGRTAIAAVRKFIKLNRLKPDSDLD